LLQLQGKLRTLLRRRPFVTATLIMRELPQPREAYIHLGGDFTRKGATVLPAAPASIAPKLEGGNRLDFARWLVDRRNPLTARVTVNRMWQSYFGKGLVETEDDFGAMGSSPPPDCSIGWRSVHGERVEPEGDSPADRDFGGVPPVIRSVRIWSAIPATPCWRANRGSAWRPRLFAIPRLRPAVS
jgi:hypothetical protein